MHWCNTDRVWREWHLSGVVGGGTTLGVFASSEIAFQRWTRLRRSALPMTETELNVIAALAIIGLSSRPNTG